MKSITLSILLMLCACCAWCVKLPVLPRTEDIRSYRFLLKRTLSVITPDHSLITDIGEDSGCMKGGGRVGCADFYEK